MDDFARSFAKLKAAHALLGQCIDEVAAHMATNRANLAASRAAVADLTKLASEQDAACKKLKAQIAAAPARGGSEGKEGLGPVDPLEQYMAAEARRMRQPAAPIPGPSSAPMTAPSSVSESPDLDSSEDLLDRMRARREELQARGSVDLRKHMAATSAMREVAQMASARPEAMQASAARAGAPDGKK